MSLIDLSPLDTLTTRLTGTILTPADPGYAAEAAPFNLSITHEPDLVVVAETSADIVAAVRYARENRLPVSVQGAGHGACVAIRGGLLISTKRLTGVHVDPLTRIATIGAGERWSSVITAAAAHGLFPIAGSSPSVGVVGYLLGGGLGPLARSHGFSSDYLESLTVVTGEGELVVASATQHPDLFWALRGGKKGLGIVTEVRFRLVPLRILYAGTIFFAEEHIEPALRAWVDWTASANPLITTSVAIVGFPPLDFIPAPLRGRRLLCLRFAYPGPATEGIRFATPLRAAAPVYLDTLAEMPVTEVGRIHSDPTEPGPYWVTGGLLHTIDQDFATTVLTHVGAGTNAPFVLEVRHLGAAVCHDVPEGSAAAGREAGFILHVAALASPELPARVGQVFDSLAPWLTGTTNINFMGAWRAKECIATAWPAETRTRLEQVKRRYDPAGVFAG